MHTTEKKGLHYGEIFIGKTIEEAYKLYYDELLYCVKNYKQFNVLGHVDLVKRYSTDQPTANFHDDFNCDISMKLFQQGKALN